MTYDELLKALNGKVELSPEMQGKLHSYALLLKEWNEKMNLTSIVEEDEVVEKHFYDCLIPAKAHSLASLNIADIGTGAGFPGLVWAIVFPSCHVSLVEATGKKCTFLAEVIKQLQLTNVEVLNKRAEELSFREHYDLVVARAVGSLPILLEITAPFAKVGGFVLAMKSSKGREEIAISHPAMQKLHLTLKDAQEDSLPNNDGLRLNFFFLKNEKTDRKYPRKWADIEKKPL